MDSIVIEKTECSIEHSQVFSWFQFCKLLRTTLSGFSYETSSLPKIADLLRPEDSATP